MKAQFNINMRFLFSSMTNVPIRLNFNSCNNNHSFHFAGKKDKKKSDDYKTMGVDGIRLYYNTI